MMRLTLITIWYAVVLMNLNQPVHAKRENIEAICNRITQQLDFDSDRPLYRQIARSVENFIEEGIFQAGDRLPPERRLMEILGVSRSTLRIALNDLTQRQYLSSTQGRGNFIQASPAQRELRLLALERFQADHWTVSPVHYDWISQSSQAVNARLHYHYVPTIEDLIYNLHHPVSGYDGILIFRALPEWSEILQRTPDTLFEQFPVPLQVIGRPIQKRGLNTITWDYFQATRLATTRLIQLGHRRIAYTGGFPVSGHSFHSFFEGYKAAMNEAGLPVLEDDILLFKEPLFVGGTTPQSINDEMYAFLKARRFTAIVPALTGNPFETSVKKLNLDIPDQLSVMLISEEHAFGSNPEFWSGFAEPSAEIVRRGIATLTSICRGQQVSGKYELIPPIERLGKSVRKI